MCPDSHNSKISRNVLCLSLCTVLLVGMLFSPSILLANSDKRGKGSQKPSVSLEHQYLDVPDIASNLLLLKGEYSLSRISRRNLTAAVELGYRRTNDRVIPNKLYRAGASVSLQGRTDRLQLNIGSASDKPFDSKDEVDWFVMGSTQARQWQKSSLHLGLFYTNRFDYPLPVISWLYFSQKLQIVAGFPVFSLNYQMNKRDRLSIAYRPVQDVSVGVERQKGDIVFGLKGVIESESYALADRTDQDEALVLETISIRLHVGKAWRNLLRLTASGGYLFDSRTYIGEDLFSVSDSNNLGNGWMAGLRIDLLK